MALAPKQIGKIAAVTPLTVSGALVTVGPVEGYRNITINQVAANVTATLPSPVDPTVVFDLSVGNVGTQSLTMYLVAIPPAGFADFFWNGTAWSAQSAISAITSAPLVSGISYQTAGATTASTVSANAVAVPGMSITLPGAGTYEIEYSVRSSSNAMGVVAGLFTGSVASANFVANSEVKAGYLSTASAIQATGTASRIVTVTSATIYAVGVWGDGGTGGSTQSDGNGRSYIQYVQQPLATYVPATAMVPTLLTSGISILSANVTPGTYAAPVAGTGMSVTLPTAGTYLIEYSAGYTSNTAGGAGATMGLFTNSVTSANLVANSECAIGYSLTNYEHSTGTASRLVTVTTATTYLVGFWGLAGSSGATVYGNTDGRCYIQYIQQAVATYVPANAGIPTTLVNGTSIASANATVTGSTTSAAVLIPGMSITVPGAGIWSINYTVRGSSPSIAGQISAAVYLGSMSAGNLVAGSEIIVIYEAAANSIQNSASGMMTVTTTAAATYVVGIYGTSGTMAMSDVNGRCSMSYQQLPIATYVPAVPIGSATGVRVDLANFTANGSMGLASATVDLASIITFSQTTTGVSVIIPTPSIITTHRTVVFENLSAASVSITLQGADSLVLSPNVAREMQWNGSGWYLLDAASVLAEYGSYTYTGANVIPAATNNTVATSVDFMTFTIPSAGVWEVITSVSAICNVTNANAFLNAALFTTANALIPNSELFVLNQYSNVATSMLQNGTTASGNAQVTTTGATTFKVRLWNVASNANAWAQSGAYGRSGVIWNKIASNVPVTGQLVDMMNGNIGSLAPAVGNALTVTYASGNMAITANSMTLPAGKAYTLMAGVTRINGTSGSSEFTFCWRDTTNNVYLGSEGSLTQNTALGAGGSAFALVPASATPITVQLWCVKNVSVSSIGTNNAGSGSTAAGFVMVQQAGSTAYSGVFINGVPAVDKILTADSASTASFKTLTGGVTQAGGVMTVVTNANLTGMVTSAGNATTVVTNANLTGMVTSSGNATTVVTNANLTGAVTSTGNATTVTQLNQLSAATQGLIPIGGNSGQDITGTSFTIANTAAYRIASSMQATIRPELVTAKAVAFIAPLSSAIAGISGTAQTTVGGGFGTLTPAPGVWNFGATAIVITGNVTFTGTATDVWVIKTSTTMNTTGGNCNMQMAGGAIASNVFWLVTGAVTLETLTGTKGTIVSQAAMSVAAQASIEGRLITSAGAISVGASTASAATLILPTGESSAVTDNTFGLLTNFVAFTGSGACTSGSTTPTVGDVGSASTIPTGWTNVCGTVCGPLTASARVVFSLQQGTTVLAGAKRTYNSATYQQIPILLETTASLTAGQVLIARAQVWCGTLATSDRYTSVTQLT